MTELLVDGRRLTVTSVDRVMWPLTGFTKGDLVAYYRRVGPAMVGHLRGRPLMLGRWPEGVHRPGWGQWECRSRPPWMEVATLRMRDGRDVETCLINDLASLVWAVNMGTVEFHPYLATAAAFDRPLAVVFDLDPGPPAGVLEAARVAVELRAVLERDGLRAVVKSSGGSGLHVFVPLGDDAATYAETKAFARSVAAELAVAHPDRVVDRMLKSVRAGRVLIDWAQNDARKQTVAPYSLRAADVPVASAPLAWPEVERAAETSDAAGLVHDAAGVVARLELHGELFTDSAAREQTLPAAAYAG